jgi:hypothetical protein
MKEQRGNLLGRVRAVAINIPGQMQQTHMPTLMTMIVIIVVLFLLYHFLIAR